MIVLKILMVLLSGGLLSYEIYKVVKDIKSRINENKPPNLVNKDDVKND